MTQKELFLRGLTRFQMLNALEKLALIAQGPSDRPQPTDMLRVTPARVVLAAGRVRDVGERWRPAELTDRAATTKRQQQD